MALKPTIFKTKITLSDLDRHYYDTINLTIAQHPSETLERMMVRVLAFCINAQPELQFSKGLSSPDEPDILARDLNDSITLWIDVGEPLPERIKKATRVAQYVKVYSFNKKSPTWWEQNRSSFQELNADVYQFPWDDVKNLVKLVQRTMDFTVTVSEESAFISNDESHYEVSWQLLRS